MTGFGTAEGPVAKGRLEVDVRTVNHRHMNVQVKVPSMLQEFEGQFREILREHISRGHVTLSARWTEEDPRDGGITINVDRAREVVAAMEKLKKFLGLSGDIDLAFVARQPDVMAYAPVESASVAVGEVTSVVRAALNDLLETRRKEGQALGDEIERLLALIESELTMVEERAPERLTAERDRLRESVATLLNGKPVDDDRLNQEIALLADKLDITEEIVRLRAHLVAAREALTGSTPVGKRLSFLGQEMLREVNTIGSKANNAVIAHHVIEMKGELEKFREQIENLE